MQALKGPKQQSELGDQITVATLNENGTKMQLREMVLPIPTNSAFVAASFPLALKIF